MENQYFKTFPDLMAGKKLLYLHGFGSSGATNTARLLRQFLPNSSVISPDLPIHPEEAMTLLEELVRTERPDLIIGTSMGGMYAEQLYGIDRICVNPALEMAETMHEHGMIGKLTFQNPRQDGVQEFIVTKAMVKEYKEMTEREFRQVTPEEQQRVFGLFGDKDDTVDTFDLFHSHYPQAIHFHGGHRLNDKVLLHYIIPVIRWIDDRQEGRERPTVLIDYESVRDSYGKPISCLAKLFEYLIEHYDVYFTAAAPTNDHGYMPEVQEWVEEYLSAPAWNRVLFTNQPWMLYGNYYISRQPQDAFIGTNVELGSNEMKTLEEVLVFFQRLGGQ